MTENSKIRHEKCSIFDILLKFLHVQNYRCIWMVLKRQASIISGRIMTTRRFCVCYVSTHNYNVSYHFVYATFIKFPIIRMVLSIVLLSNCGYENKKNYQDANVITRRKSNGGSQKNMKNYINMKIIGFVT